MREVEAVVVLVFSDEDDEYVSAEGDVSLTRIIFGSVINICFRWVSSLEGKKREESH